MNEAPPPVTAKFPEKRFSLIFSMENDAFQGRRTTAEIMRILGVVSGYVATGRFSGTVMDSNGYTVGSFDTTWRQDPADKG